MSLYRTRRPEDDQLGTKTGIGINWHDHRAGFIVGNGHRRANAFYLFTVENLKQFGALKATGASTFTLARMILLQAFTVGFIGYGIGIGRHGFVFRQQRRAALCRNVQLLLIASAHRALGICARSALIGIVKPARLEPAIVFR